MRNMSETRLLVSANKGARSGHPLVDVTPETAGWTYVGFAVYRMAQGEHLPLTSEGVELTVIVLEGTCDVTVGEQAFAGVGGRQSVFAQAPPEAVYAPPGQRIEVIACTRTEVAVATAKAPTGAGSARRITGDEMPYEKRGEGFTRRYVRHILDEHHAATKLLLVEVITPGGHWSSFPPHKHDEDLPGQESYLEETYYYRLDPPQGTAISRVYDKQGLSAALTPHDGDVVLVPRGYHPVASPPGFTTYYLNVMAGHNRVWLYQLDRDYAHISPKDGNIMGQIVQGSV